MHFCFASGSKLDPTLRSPNSWMKDLDESDKFSAHDISSNVLAELNKEILIHYLH